MTHIKQQKYFHRLKRRAYIIQSSYYIHGPLGDENIFAVLCHFAMGLTRCCKTITLLWALHVVVKQQFFPHLYFAVLLLD